MDLEKILDGFEDKIETHLDQTGAIGRFFYGQEIMTLKETLNNSRNMRSNYTDTQEWFFEYGQLLTDVKRQAHDAIDKTYSIADFVNPIYQLISKIPIVGEWIESKKGNFKDKFGIKNNPSRQALHEMVDKNYEAAISNLCMLGHIKTDQTYEHYWESITQPSSDSNIMYEKGADNEKDSIHKEHEKIKGFDFGKIDYDTIIKGVNRLIQDYFIPVRYSKA